MNYIIFTHVAIYQNLKNNSLIEYKMKNKILILSGDPNSVNSEIIYKAWIKLHNSLKKEYILFQIVIC